MNRSPRSGDPADSRHRVLVVDDEASIADIVSEALRLCGHDVRPAASTAELEGLRELKRGVYARRPLKAGEPVVRDAVYFAMPC